LTTAAASISIMKSGPARPRFPLISSKHSYAVANQDCRGRFPSGRRFVRYLIEAEDGFDMLAQLQRPPWCKGRVCAFGLPYPATFRQRSAVLTRQD
jgi:uncharacterized protein